VPEWKVDHAGFRQRTIGSRLNEWLAIVNANVVSGQDAVRTYSDHEMVVRVPILPYLGSTRITDLSEAALWKWTTAPRNLLSIPLAKPKNQGISAAVEFTPHRGRRRPLRF
jgi:hypothetical protein